MPVLKHSSPKVVPENPTLLPVKQVPSESTSRAGFAKSCRIGVGFINDAYKTTQPTALRQENEDKKTLPFTIDDARPN
jgi:hypothetical protein